MSAAEQRQAIADLAELARRDLFKLLSGVAPKDYRDALAAVLPQLGSAYGDAAAALAADWYESLREAAEVRGRFAPVLAREPDVGRWESLAGWAASHLDPLALAAGGLQRSIADQHRLTIVGSSIADPAAAGWKRVARAGACGFCRMLAGRDGAVYTEASVDFKSHDNCSCTASPSWAPNVTKVIGVPFRYSQKKASWSAERKARENRRVYDFLADS